MEDGEYGNLSLASFHNGNERVVYKFDKTGVHGTNLVLELFYCWGFYSIVASALIATTAACTLPLKGAKKRLPLFKLKTFSL